MSLNRGALETEIRVSRLFGVIRALPLGLAAVAWLALAVWAGTSMWLPGAITLIATVRLALTLVRHKSVSSLSDSELAKRAEASRSVAGERPGKVMTAFLAVALLAALAFLGERLIGAQALTREEIPGTLWPALIWLGVTSATIVDHVQGLRAPRQEVAGGG